MARVKRQIFTAFTIFYTIIKACNTGTKLMAIPNSVRIALATLVL